MYSQDDGSLTLSVDNPLPSDKRKMTITDLAATSTGNTNMEIASLLPLQL